MKTIKLLVPVIAILLLTQVISFAQFAPRQDVIWARTVPAGTITMDGVLNEAAWSQAESLEIVYGQPGLLPSSGWRAEAKRRWSYRSNSCNCKISCFK